MKNNYFFTLALTLLFAFNSKAQTCTPDQNIPEDIYYGEDGFQDAVVDIEYSQTIYFRVPTDTVVSYQGNDLDATINYLQVNDIENLPEGLTYVCNPSNCQFPGGTFGCVNIYGTPTVEGNYSLVLKAVLNGEGEFNNFPINQNLDYDQNIEMEVKPDDVTNVSTIDGIGNVSLFPNPTQNSALLNIESNETGVLEVAVVNLLGNRVYNELNNNFNGSYTKTFQKADLGKGLFFVVIKLNGKEEVSKLIIQ